MCLFQLNVDGFGRFNKIKASHRRLVLRTVAKIPCNAAIVGRAVFIEDRQIIDENRFCTVNQTTNNAFPEQVEDRRHSTRVNGIIGFNRRAAGAAAFLAACTCDQERQPFLLELFHVQKSLIT